MEKYSNLSRRSKRMRQAKSRSSFRRPFRGAWMTGSWHMCVASDLSYFEGNEINSTEIELFLTESALANCRRIIEQLPRIRKVLPHAISYNYWKTKNPSPKIIPHPKDPSKAHLEKGRPPNTGRRTHIYKATTIKCPH